MQAMAERGINILRVPVSTRLVKEWMSGGGEVSSMNDYANPDLDGLSSLEIFDQVLLQAKSCGIKILVDQHSADADNSGHNAPLWYKDDITSGDFFDTWEWFAARYKNDDTIVAYDLENEPHGSPDGSAGATLSRGENESWEDYCQRKPLSQETDYAKWDDSTDEHNWRYAAEVAAERILAINPNVLIMVEGTQATPKYGKWVDNKSGAGEFSDKCYDNTWWGGNLRLAAELPVEVAGHNEQIMYSPHDYGPAVYMQPWFKDGQFTRESLEADVWGPNWLYLHDENISPLLIGEWGGFMDGGDNQKWMEAIRDEIILKGLHHTFWCLNPNSGDTGGLLGQDWVTWDEEKYGLLKPALWQKGGKFVGLDKVVPLGGDAGTGITRP
ncbi:Aryl-phospho-beta-D-glucosidase BglC, GH1 family [Alteromonadaceae bacterium Bs31]|nr:Aryl-phospho-beta-D-glucosidase BglC, GH1 family [Alteromonadaceae bacterium Bs31]